MGFFAGAQNDIVGFFAGAQSDIVGFFAGAQNDGCANSIRLGDQLRQGLIERWAGDGNCVDRRRTDRRGAERSQARTKLLGIGAA